MLEPGGGSSVSAHLGTTIANSLRVNKDLIDALGFVIAGLLLPDLLLETQSLLKGIVQLGVGVAELFAAHEPLETLAQAWARAVVLGKR